MTPLVELRNVEFAYGRSRAARGGAGRPFALRGVSLAVAPGEVVGLLGPNSAGKTTLLRLVTGVLAPVAGEVLLDGSPLRTAGPWAVGRAVAMVPQEAPRPFPFTVAELVLMGRYPHGPWRYFESEEDLAAARDAMAATRVLELGPLPLDELSGGERQRALLARALAQEPRLLVLDEPTAHLDLRHQVEAAELLRRANRERGVGILLVSHDLGLAAELCDRLVLLSEGRVVRAGSPEAVLEGPVLEAVFGCPVSVDKHPVSHRPVVHVAWPPLGRR